MAVSDSKFARFEQQLSSKLKMAFATPNDMMQFFDLSGTETLRIDEFVFGVQFFITGSRLTECLMLFQKLDTAQDGLLDESEIEALFGGEVGLPDHLEGDYFEGPTQRDAINRYMRGGYGTYNKRPLDMHELYELPRFGGQLRNKMDIKRRGREVGRDLSPNAAYHQQAMNKEKPRKLVILPAKPPPRKPRSVMKHEPQPLTV